MRRTLDTVLLGGRGGGEEGRKGEEGGEEMGGEGRGGEERGGEEGRRKVKERLKRVK